jgi:phenylpropionate dioxygenase-like ring-hydroxylating dioxygenase large terminal subunit
MGELLRRFWLPALLEEEVPVPDCAPVRLRLLGEDLVAFRDSSSRVGILGAHCSHRGAGLFFGRNEECGLRCAYHGWKFDADGNCVEMPAEPDGGTAAARASAAIKAYPATVRAGVVWTYMGPKEFSARPPEFEWSRLPAMQRTATKRLQQCNWAQAVEGGIDSSHISFLHSRTDKQFAANPAFQPRNKYHALDRRPVFEVKETDYGLLIAARRDAEDGYYWRVTQFLVPCYTMIPPVGNFRDSSETPYSGHAWVPIDDENTWTWSFSANPHRAYTDEEYADHASRTGLWGPVDEHYRPLLNKSNDYLIDRARQRNENFTGIVGIPNQDAALQESLGTISDRSREHLRHSDRGIVNFRRLMLRLAKQLREGKAPAAAARGEWYKVRPASVVLDRDADLHEGAARLLHAG